MSAMVFLNKGFKLQRNAWNWYHDLLMMSMKISNIAILKIKGSDYCCIVIGIRKSDAIKKILQKRGTL